MADTQTKLPQTLGEHVYELRARLKWFALFFAFGATIGYALHQRFIEILKSPLHEKIYYTSPAGGFNFVMKICVVFGLVFALPALIYNIISFIRPAFRKEIKTSTIRLIAALSLVLALGGGAFAFVVVVPGSLHFFGKFTDGVQPLLSATDYLSFVINCVISFMVIFQAPLIILFIDRIKPLTPRQLLGFERYVIVGSLAAALILPFTYDPLTQFLIALPIIALYNLSIIFIAVIHVRRKRHQRMVSRAAAAYRTKEAAPKPLQHRPAVAATVATPQPARQTLQPRPAMAATVTQPQPRQQVASQPAYRQRQVMDIMPRRRPMKPQSYMGPGLTAASEIG